MKKISFLFSLLFLLGTCSLSAQWSQLGSDIDGDAADDWSGYAVSLSTDGKRLAIGAHQNDINGFEAGQVRVYAESGGVWTQVGSDIYGEAAGDAFGFRVSLSADGKRVAVGAINNGGSGFHAGHVRVYAESGGTWTQSGGDIDGEVADDWSGYSVSLSADGKCVAIGAYRNDGNGADAGHVRVYKQTESNWDQVGIDIDGEAADDRSGRSVSLSADGKRLAIGAGGNDGNGTDAGHARVYAESGGIWEQLGSDIDGEDAGDAFGVSVSLSPDSKRLAIGAINNDDGGIDAGHVRVFSESGGVWTQVGGDIDGVVADDRSGWSVSLSSNGTRLAIGAYQNDGNGTDAGHVRVFSESGGTWTQVASDIDGEAAGDWSGHSVSLSGTGQRVAIGAYRNDGSDTNAGHVRVYEGPPLEVNAEMAEQQELEIFPNPAGNEITFHLPGFRSDAAELMLLDYSGKAVWQTTLEEGQHELTLNLSSSAFISGVYYVKVSSASNVLTKRLVVSK
ncbi:MAG: T9SS type A sorting domain-containing protein [Saprospiraceae bacterium]|nr:T9SS type A sorting domain-containing protein [Saprospiraceae bacterium]